MTDKTCITCGRAISMERGLPNNEYWESRASSNVFCKATGIMMATADCAPLCEGRFWIEKQIKPHARTCHLIPDKNPHNCEGPAWDCSVCGYEFDEYIHQTAMFCQNCGSKVVDDE